MPELRSADLLVKNILGDSNLVDQLRTEPGKVLTEAAAAAKAETPLMSDVWIYRLVVIFLGALAIIVALGVIGITFLSVNKPSEGLVALGSAAVGALAGLLAPSPARSS
jgi:hypothetical protein